MKWGGYNKRGEERLGLLLSWARSSFRCKVLAMLFLLMCYTIILLPVGIAGLRATTRPDGT